MRPNVPSPAWEPVAQMIKAAEKTWEYEKKHLLSLLEQSDRLLVPWGDPLTVDLGMHRWLSGEREEAYSDWLEWIVKQIKKPNLVFRLFGCECQPEWCTRLPTLEVRREMVVPHGYPGYTGRLDILIDYKDDRVPLLVVEVKKGDIERAGTKKQRGYERSLKDKYPNRKRCAVLLVRSANEIVSEGNFVVHTWAKVCQELRRMAARELKHDVSPIVVALILAFVAAVEQNLLDFSSDLIRRIKEDKDGSVYFFNTDVVYHIDESLQPGVDFMNPTTPDPVHDINQYAWTSPRMVSAQKRV